MQNYITQSLTLHLFFARIMKEHAIFLEAGFTPKNIDLAKQADWYKKQFERILWNIVKLSNGKVSQAVLNSGEIVTEYTIPAEKKTQYFTNIEIDNAITEAEQHLTAYSSFFQNDELNPIINDLNQQALALVDGLIEFKEQLLSNVISCTTFTANYPLLIEHIIREAKLYRSYILALLNGDNIDNNNLKQTELFWNQIMMEHALFIRGLLDPTEQKLINTSDEFAKIYQNLLIDVQNATDATMKNITNTTLQETLKYRNFKIAGTKALQHVK